MHQCPFCDRHYTPATYASHVRKCRGTTASKSGTPPESNFSHQLWSYYLEFVFFFIPQQWNFGAIVQLPFALAILAAIHYYTLAYLAGYCCTAHTVRELYDHTLLAVKVSYTFIDKMISNLILDKTAPEEAIRIAANAVKELLQVARNGTNAQ